MYVINYLSLILQPEQLKIMFKMETHQNQQNNTVDDASTPTITTIASRYYGWAKPNKILQTKYPQCERPKSNWGVLGLISSVNELSLQEDERNKTLSDHESLQQGFSDDGWYYDGDEDGDYGGYEDDHHDGQSQTMVQGQQNQ
jgi:hypothetical protein